MLSLPKKSPKPKPDRPVSFTGTTHSCHRVCMETFYRIITSFAPWKYLAQLEKGQFGGAVSGGKAALAAWASLPRCTQVACRTGTVGEREHRFPCHHVLEHGSAQAWLWRAGWVLSGLCKLELVASLWHQPVCLNPVSGTGRRGQCSPLLSSWDGTVCPAGFCSWPGHGQDPCL